MSGIAFGIYATVAQVTAFSNKIMLLHHTANKIVEISQRCIFIYTFVQLFLLFSFISATGDSQEETEVMETAVPQEKCLPSEATTGKSDSVMSEFSCQATC